MKKINILLIIITLIFAGFTIFSELDKGLVIFLKDASIILTITLPYILNKVFKLNIRDGFIFIWIVFIFFAHYLGVIAEFYNKWYYFDKVVHTFSGILSSSVAIIILEKTKSKNLFLNILFILSFAWLCAGLWETFEFTCNALFGGDAQKVVETGVTDTMLDMIVAFIGSIFVSIYYYLKKK